MSSPSLTRLTLARLLMKSPADARSAIESAICAVTRVVRKRDAPRVADVLARTAPERGYEVWSRAMQSGEEPEEESHRQRQRARERQRAPDHRERQAR